MFRLTEILPFTSSLNSPSPALSKSVIERGLAGKVVPNPTLDTLPPTSGTIKSPRTETPIPVVLNFFIPALYKATLALLPPCIFNNGCQL